MNERDLFIAALEKAPNQRAAFLRQACGNDSEMLERVSALLEESDGLGSFLETPADGPADQTEAARSTAAQSQPERLGDFEIVREVGRGGMGIVYEARQLSLNRKVALKVLSGGLGLSTKSILRFRREAEAAAKLHHTNIVPVHTTGDVDGTYFYAMEYVDGLSLDQVIRQLRVQQDVHEKKQQTGTNESSQEGHAGLAETCDSTARGGGKQTHLSSTSSLSTSGSEYFDTAARMIADVAEALQHAHGHGVVHRDIKPSNLILGQDGLLQVMDFGLAKLLDEPGVTMSGDFLGTPRYMSPEQIAAGRVRVDHRTDVYSLGATLYELLTLRPPHPGDRREEVMGNILTREPPRLRRVNKKIPIDLETICLKALEKDPDKRYQTAGQMAEDLRRYLNRYAIQARRAGLPTRVAKFVRRNRAATSVSVVILLLVATAGLTAYHYGQTRVELIAEQAVLRAERSARSQMPQLRTLIDDSNWVGALALAEEIARHLPDDPTLQKWWPEFSRKMEIATEPPDAVVSVKFEEDAESEWIQLGNTPLTERLPKGVLSWRIEKDGYETFESRNLWPLPKMISLDPVPGICPGMVRVQPSRHGVRMALSGLHCDWVDVPEFLLDRYEVTNRQFQTFVEQKGYANPVFWKHEFVRKGAVISWTQAMQYFHDSTGRPGPKDWINGTFPSGEGEHPVRGISWYEAAAYAAFAGKRLPSIFEWSWASSVFFVEGPIASRSNLEGTNPVPVGSFDSFATYGNYDMAGNVKEWCWNSAGNGKRYALGGSWDEPRYMFHQTDAASPFERPSTYGFRCAKDLGDNEPPPKTLAEMLQPYRNYSEETPASDAMFASYLSHFDYDKEELQPTIEVFDDDDDCIRQEITLRSENQEKVLTAALYLPRNAEPPYQTVIFFGGSSAIRNTARLPDPPARHILKSGRALLHPSYFGTYDRRQNPNIENVFPDRTVFFRNHVIAWIQDVGKCIDYLETRDDIDSERTAFFGFSWGGAMGAIVPAVETRLRASVLLYGGFYRQAARPEVDQLNFAPRVKTPTLMLNNKYDFLFDHEAAQKPMFQLLGLPEEDKRHVVEDASGHFMPLKLVSRETSEWLDKYLGPVRRLRSPTGQAE